MVEKASHMATNEIMAQAKAKGINPNDQEMMDQFYNQKATQILAFRNYLQKNQECRNLVMQHAFND